MPEKTNLKVGGSYGGTKKSNSVQVVRGSSHEIWGKGKGGG